jgi:hypothetical protein
LPIKRPHAAAAPAAHNHSWVVRTRAASRDLAAFTEDPGEARGTGSGDSMRAHLAGQPGIVNWRSHQSRQAENGFHQQHGSEQLVGMHANAGTDDMGVQKVLELVHAYQKDERHQTKPRPNRQATSTMAVLEIRLPTIGYRLVKKVRATSVLARGTFCPSRGNTSKR